MAHETLWHTLSFGRGTNVPHLWCGSHVVQVSTQTAGCIFEIMTDLGKTNSIAVYTLIFLKYITITLTQEMKFSSPAVNKYLWPSDENFILVVGKLLGKFNEDLSSVQSLQENESLVTPYSSTFKKDKVDSFTSGFPIQPKSQLEKPSNAISVKRATSKVLSLSNNVPYVDNVIPTSIQFSHISQDKNSDSAAVGHISDRIILDTDVSSSRIRLGIMNKPVASLKIKQNDTRIGAKFYTSTINCQQSKNSADRCAKYIIMPIINEHHNPKFVKANLREHINYYLKENNHRGYNYIPSHEKNNYPESNDFFNTRKNIYNNLPITHKQSAFNILSRAFASYNHQRVTPFDKRNYQNIQRYPLPFEYKRGQNNHIPTVFNFNYFGPSSMGFAPRHFGYNRNTAVKQSNNGNRDLGNSQYLYPAYVHINMQTKTQGNNFHSSQEQAKDAYIQNNYSFQISTYGHSTHSSNLIQHSNSKYPITRQVQNQPPTFPRAYVQFHYKPPEGSLRYAGQLQNRWLPASQHIAQQQ